MELAKLIKEYIAQPFPVWNSKLTRELVNGRWKYFRNEHLWDLNRYNTAGCVLKNPSISVKRTPITCKSEPYIIYMESPSFEYLTNFYKENGLNLYTEGQLEKICALEKLGYALDIIKLVSPVYDYVLNLVRAIQVIKSHNIDNDASYSHPDIPFSIFVSVCQDSSEHSNLRVAESILHEAMHLKLSLIENIVELVTIDSVNQYFSPWRQTFRPPSGIVHGIYVFRVLFDFYQELLVKQNLSKESKRFILNRSNEIKNQINTLRDFKDATELSMQGRILVSNLTKIEN